MIDFIFGILDFIFLGPICIILSLFSSKKNDLNKKPDIVILHGFATRGKLFELMKKRLERLNYSVAIFEYNSLTKSVDEITNEFSEFVSGFSNFTIIGHSLGGVIALNYYLGNEKKVKKLITLGSPFHELWLPKTLFFIPTFKSLRKFEVKSENLKNVYSILSTADIIAHPKHNYLKSANNIVLNRIGHVYMIVSSRVFSKIKSILN